MTRRGYTESLLKARVVAAGHAWVRDHRWGCPANDNSEVRVIVGDRDEDLLARCEKCSRYRILPRDLLETAVPVWEQPARRAPVLHRWSLDCIKCGVVINLDSPKPRVPLCDVCKSTRARTQDTERRKQRAHRLKDAPW